MKKRKFIVATAGSALFWNIKAFSSTLSTHFGRIVPEERDEKREYDLSVPDKVVWKSKEIMLFSPRKTIMRTVGFVESESYKDKILYIPGILVRQEVLRIADSGFFLYFNVALNYIPLPRAVVFGGKSHSVDRYEFDDDTTFIPSMKIKKGMVEVDYKKMKIIENERVYLPDSIVYEALSPSGALLNQPPTLKVIDGNKSYPARDVPGSSFEVGDVLYFKMDHTPLKFKLELPPLIINDAQIPLPICYFEPYDITNKKWTN